jgi:Trypsin-like peptidase domain
MSPRNRDLEFLKFAEIAVALRRPFPEMFQLTDPDEFVSEPDMPVALPYGNLGTPLYVSGRVRRFPIENALIALSSESTSRFIESTAAQAAAEMTGIGAVIAHGPSSNDPFLESTFAGTCIYIGAGWVLTAKHVLDTHEFARSFQVAFGFKTAPDLLLTPDNSKAAFQQAIKIPISDQAGHFFASNDGIRSADGHTYSQGDWAVLKLAAMPPRNIIPFRAKKVVTPLAGKEGELAFIPFFNTRGSENLSEYPVPLSALLTIRLPQNVDEGGAQSVVVINPLATDLGLFPGINRVLGVRSDKIMHRINVHSGASGAPVITLDGGFVGMHTSSFTEGLGPGVSVPISGQYGLATSAISIAQALKKLRFPDLQKVSLGALLR